MEVLFYGCEGLLTAPPLGEIFITSIIQISHYNFINGPFAMFYHAIVIFVVISGSTKANIGTFLCYDFGAVTRSDGRCRSVTGHDGQ